MVDRHTNRRVFLQGLGGLALAAPFLGTLFHRSAAGAVTSDPKRIVVFFTHYGCITNRYFPKKSHGLLTQNDYDAIPTLSPLAPFAKKLLMVRGVRAMNEWSFDQELGQETDPHTQVMNAYFTCCPTDGWSGLGTSLVNSATPTRKSNGKPVGGRSLDHIIAEQINNPARPTPLYLGIGGGQNSQQNTMTTLSYSAPGAYDHAAHSIVTEATLYPSIGSPLTVYSNLTKLLSVDATGLSPTEASYQVASGKHVLDLCRDDLKRLKAQSVSSADKLKIEAWEALLTDTGKVMNPAISRGCTDSARDQLGITEMALNDGNTYKIDKAMPITSALAALSLLCDDNRVIFMKTPAAHTYTHLEVTIDHASLSHRQGNAGLGGGVCVKNVNNVLAKIDHYHATSFANLVGLLDGVPEGDGTLLDNTATIWFQEMSDGLAHNLNNLPILQAGGCGGYFKLGCAVNVDGAAEDLSQGNSEVFCTDVSGGDPVPSNQLGNAGTPKQFANAPINKYYCSLMNALGVKAGADGYAQKDGTEVVSRFGYYDETRDFATFLSDSPAPSKIKFPGEFEELKA
jgi:hypothetical protein